MRQGSEMFMALYDLEKAFDSVEVPVLLSRLFEAGFKCWWLLRNSYDGYCGMIRVGQESSPPFLLEHGVHQGSVLSPSLFLLVMNPLFKALESSSLGLSVNNMYVAGFLHADDICTLSNSINTLEAQIATVKGFTTDNFFKLNISKSEFIVLQKSQRGHEISCDIDNVTVHSEDVVKCLSYLWKSDLSSWPMIEEKISSARKGFFKFDSISAFHGHLSPNSPSSVFECFVLPILVYNIENWILSSESLKFLECFAAEIANRILIFPKWYSNNAVRVALG